MRLSMDGSVKNGTMLSKEGPSGEVGIFTWWIGVAYTRGCGIFKEKIGVPGRPGELKWVNRQ